MFKTIQVKGLLALIGLQLAACSGGGGATTGSATTGTSTATTGKSSGPSTAPSSAAPTPPKAVEMTDLDLGTADPKWKGWTAKGPAESKVLADGVEGARIAAKGPSMLDRKPGGDNGFDIAFAWGKEDFKAFKDTLQKGVDNPVGGVKGKLTFTKDEPDFIEWTFEVGDSKTYSFQMHMNVEKTDVTCKDNYMVGAGNPEERKRDEDACKTLSKKK